MELCGLFIELLLVESTSRRFDTQNLCHDKIYIPRSAGTPTFRRIDSAPLRSQVSKYTQ